MGRIGMGCGRKGGEKIMTTSIMMINSLMSHTMNYHGGQDDSILSVIQAKSRSKSSHQRNSCQILQNCATESRRACAELVPKLLLRIPL
jgi:hypothetical protein